MGDYSFNFVGPGSATCFWGGRDYAEMDLCVEDLGLGYAILTEGTTWWDYAETRCTAYALAPWTDDDPYNCANCGGYEPAHTACYDLNPPDEFAWWKDSHEELAFENWCECINMDYWTGVAGELCNNTDEWNAVIDYCNTKYSGTTDSDNAFKNNFNGDEVMYGPYTENHINSCAWAQAWGSITPCLETRCFGDNSDNYFVEAAVGDSIAVEGTNDGTGVVITEIDDPDACWTSYRNVESCCLETDTVAWRQYECLTNDGTWLSTLNDCEYDTSVSKTSYGFYTHEFYGYGAALDPDSLLEYRWDTVVSEDPKVDDYVEETAWTRVYRQCYDHEGYGPGQNPDTTVHTNVSSDNSNFCNIGWYCETECPDCVEGDIIVGRCWLECAEDGWGDPDDSLCPFEFTCDAELGCVDPVADGLFGDLDGCITYLNDVYGYDPGDLIANPSPGFDASLQYCKDSFCTSTDGEDTDCDASIEQQWARLGVLQSPSGYESCIANLDDICMWGTDGNDGTPSCAETWLGLMCNALSIDAAGNSYCSEVITKPGFAGTLEIADAYAMAVEQVTNTGADWDCDEPICADNASMEGSVYEADGVVLGSFSCVCNTVDGLLYEGDPYVGGCQDPTEREAAWVIEGDSNASSIILGIINHQGHALSDSLPPIWNFSVDASVGPEDLDIADLGDAGTWDVQSGEVYLSTVTQPVTLEESGGTDTITEYHPLTGAGHSAPTIVWDGDVEATTAAGTLTMSDEETEGLKEKFGFDVVSDGLSGTTSAMITLINEMAPDSFASVIGSESLFVSRKIRKNYVNLNEKMFSNFDTEETNTVTGNETAVSTAKTTTTTTSDDGSTY